MIKSEEKEKYMIYVKPETIKKADDIFKKVGFKCRSDFIDKAIIFYCGYVSSVNFEDYYPEVIVSTVKASLDSFQDRMGSLLFKNAVELDMLMHITAANYELDSDILKRIRGKCVDEVKKLHGRVSLDDAYKYKEGK